MIFIRYSHYNCSLHCKFLCRGDVLISCKNSRFNHHKGQTYTDLSTQVLASGRWKKYNAKDDSFTFNPIRGVSYKTILPTVLVIIILYHFVLYWDNLRGHYLFLTDVYNICIYTGENTYFILPCFMYLTQWKHMLSGTLYGYIF